MLQQRWSIFLIAIICILQARGADKYTDENRPYEFGFTIDGEQHRHEKKDEKGIIMGEFGFITADGVYHVTVYATDENGNFKILSMKNIRVKPYPTAPAREGHSLSFPPPKSPAQTKEPLPAVGGPSVASPAKSCSSCSLPTTTTPRPPQLLKGQINEGGASQPQYPGISGAPNAKYPGAPGTPIAQNPQATKQNYPQNQASGPGQNYPQNQASEPGQNYPQTQASRPGQNYPQNQASELGQNYPQTQASRPGQNYPQNQASEPGQNYPGNQASGPGQNYPGQNNPRPGANYPQSGAGAGGGIASNYPQLSTNDNFPQGPGAANQYPQQTGPSSAPSPGNTLQAPLESNTGDRSPKQFTDYPQQPVSGQQGGAQGQSGLEGGQGPSKPTLISAQMQIVDKNTDIYAKKPGEKNGLPDGITKDDMVHLLYTFNYTVGFHGHFEEGYTNGAKQGYYFVTGRNGVRTRVDYVADEKGFRPKITQEVLDLLSEDVPKPETEKDEKYGLKGYEFKWLYYPADSKRR